MDLNKLLRPSSIAVIGANDKNGFGKSTCTNLLHSPLQDHIYFVNPNRTELFGKKCYASITDVPETVDMSIIILNKKLAGKALEEAALAGCKAAVIYASGYGETGDKESEEELRRICRQYDMAVMGANCAGFINNLDGIYAFGMLINRESVPGNIAIISQSGKICLNMMQIGHMDYSYLISSGNSTCVKVEDYLEYMIHDKDTKVIGLYLEGIKDAEKFARLMAEAAKKRKPIVIMKVGKTAKGSALAASHTGSLSGSDKSFDAVVKKFGVIRVDDIEELAEMCHLLSVIPMLPPKPTLAAMCLSGGETGICADMGTLMGLTYPELADQTRSRLKELLPDYATPANPLDMSATLAHDGTKYAGVIQAFIDDPSIGMVICGQTVLQHHQPQDVINPMSDGMVMAAKEKKKPVVVMSFFNSSRDEGIRKKLESEGVPILPATGGGFKLLKYLMDFVSYNPADHTLELAVPNKKKTEKLALSEYESKEELKRYGILMPEEHVAVKKSDLTEFHVQFPAAAKIISRDILHKSDVGGVVLNIQNQEELYQAFDKVMKNSLEHCPNARIDGVLISPMLPKGDEFIVGVHNDPQFGPMILCGLGGIFVEVFKDASLYPAPLNKKEALAMVQSLKGSKLLSGYRGKEKGDMDALARLIVQISEYAVTNKDSLEELDINPVFVYPEGRGVAIADALIVKRK